MTRRELVAEFGRRYGLLLGQLDAAGDEIERHPSRYQPGWHRIELVREAPADLALDVVGDDDGPEQMALDVRGSAPPASALSADLEDAA